MIRRKNLRDPATLHRSPTLVKAIGSSKSNPESCICEDIDCSPLATQRESAANRATHFKNILDIPVSVPGTCTVVDSVPVRFVEQRASVKLVTERNHKVRLGFCHLGHIPTARNVFDILVPHAPGQVHHDIVALCQTVVDTGRKHGGHIDFALNTGGFQRIQFGESKVVVQRVQQSIARRKREEVRGVFATIIIVCFPVKKIAILLIMIKSKRERYAPVTRKLRLRKWLILK